MNNNLSYTSIIHRHDHKTHAARARKLSLSNKYTCKKYKICARKILTIIVLFRCLFCCVACVCIPRVLLYSAKLLRNVNLKFYLFE